MHLSGILKIIEKPDGSVLHEEVKQKVEACDGALVLWSEIVGDFDATDSHFLRDKIVTLRPASHRVGRTAPLCPAPQ